MAFYPQDTALTAGMALAGVLADDDTDGLRTAAFKALDIFNDLAAPPPVKRTPAELRSVLDDAGVTFGDCVQAFAAPIDDPMVLLAKAIHNNEGRVEVDIPSVRSDGDDDGTYIMAWVWVDNPEEADTDFADLDP